MSKNWSDFEKARRHKEAEKQQNFLDHAISQEGVESYEIDSIEKKNSSSFYVHFKVNGYDKKANFMKNAKEYFGRITKDVVRRLEETCPKVMRINMEVQEYYVPGIPGNVMQYRKYFQVIDEDLFDWFKKASDL